MEVRLLPQRAMDSTVEWHLGERKKVQPVEVKSWMSFQESWQSHNGHAWAMQLTIRAEEVQKSTNGSGNCFASITPHLTAKTSATSLRAIPMGPATAPRNSPLWLRIMA